ncbi:prolipoprotein diacylglyceryl transferase, partial [Oceanibaculum nanhaiense]
IVCAAAPIGLFFGRIANFINGELYGRVTDAALGMVFPHGGPLPRHPSQLYQAGLEGLALFVLMAVLIFGFNAKNRPGLLAGAFFAGYGVARCIGEFFREPDAFLGFLWFGATMGQLLSLPMILLGLYLVRRALTVEPSGDTPKRT